MLRRRFSQVLGLARSTCSTAPFKKFSAWVCSNLVKNVPGARAARSPALGAPQIPTEKSLKSRSGGVPYKVRQTGAAGEMFVFGSRTRSSKDFAIMKKSAKREDRVNFRLAWRPAGMSRHNQQRSVEEGRSLLEGTHAIKV